MDFQYNHNCVITINLIDNKAAKAHTCYFCDEYNIS